MTTDRRDDHKPEAASRSRHAKRPPTASEQLEELLGYSWPFPGRPPKHDLSTWAVTDDWPEQVPIGDAELRVIEGAFREELNALFGPLP